MPRAFVYTLVGVNLAGALAGAAYAARQGMAAAVAGPLVAAFLLQISLYLLPGFPAAREWVRERLGPVRLAAVLAVGAVAPYLVYSLPTGVFRFPALLKLAAIGGVLAFVYVVWPSHSRRLTWQDLVVLATVGVAELGKQFREIYASPVEGLRVDILGRLMIVGVGATALLSLRRLEGCGYRLGWSREDWKTGLGQFGLFLPIGVLVGTAIGFARFRPVQAEPWRYPLLAVGTFLGMYLVVALFEELFFRGALQNLVGASLRSPPAGQVVASVAFGLVHLPFRAFPNWRHVILAAILGWFCGQAWRRGNVVAASITHALAATVWRLLLAG